MFNKVKNVLSATLGDYIQADLGRLNDIAKGLGDDAARYVKTGDGGEVLATLANTEIDPDFVLCLSHRSTGAQQDAYKKRGELFTNSEPYDIPLIVRYAEVLEAASTKMPPSFRRFPGDTRRAFEIVCDTVFNTVHELGRATGFRQGKPVKGFTPERAISLGAALGVEAEDVLRNMLWTWDEDFPRHGGFYAKLVDFAPVFRAHSEAVFKAAKSLDHQARLAMLTKFDSDGLVQEEPFLSYLFYEAGASVRENRDNAFKIIKTLPAALVEKKAIELVDDGKASVREGMVTILSGVGSEAAFAALKTRLDTEKTSQVKAAIENALLVAKATQGDAEAGHDTPGYQALDGTWIEIPPKRDLPPDTVGVFGAEMRARIEKIVTDHNAELEKRGPGHERKLIKSPQKFIDNVFAALNNQELKDYDDFREPCSFLKKVAPADWENILKPVPLIRQIHIYAQCRDRYSEPCFRRILSEQVFPDVMNWLLSSDGDVRVLEAEIIKAQQLLEQGKIFEPGRLLWDMVGSFSYMPLDISELNSDAIWPYLAEYPQAIEGALTGSYFESKMGALAYLKHFPKTPMRYLGPLLEIATAEGKTGRAEARALLAEAPGLDDRLVDLLEDKRQGIRAGAADWLAERGCKNAIKPLHKRLKKEKSEVAKAALLGALQVLGGDVSGYVGPEALIKESEAGLKKAKFDKLDWLDLDYIPKLAWQNGDPVPSDVPKWWVFLANKLKQPGGNRLFEIYLDQLQPESAEAFSSWIFDSWVSYDTKQPDDSEGIAYAQAHVKASFPKWKRYMPSLTEDQCFQMLKRQITSRYLNSGAASKGLLGLATRVPAARAADQVRNFLKNHGSRTSQATSLLELMAAKGDPVSLQVVIAAATRLKQKGVQAKAGEMVEAVAEAHGWSIEELADRTIPTGGLDDDGRLELPCGPMEKLYTAQIGDDLSIILRNPDGKEIKALPSGDDEASKASKKQLSASKREIKQVIKAQADRLYEGVCAERVWSQADWQRDFYNHPVMRRLVERVVWLGLGGDGQILASFRPTAEGDFIDTEDNSVDISAFPSIRLAHGALVSDEAGAAWVEHLKDYEVKPLFRQFGRNLMRLPEDQPNANEITDREGWLTDAFNIRSAASKLGYERGEAEDGGWFGLYRKPFKAANLTAVIEFTGNVLPEENIPAALKTLSFVQGDRTGYGARKIALSKVPPVLLSECWNDYHEMAAKAVFDPEWEKKAGW